MKEWGMIQQLTGDLKSRLDRVNEGILYLYGS